MLTKTDFLHYLDAPMHLWADKHGQTERTWSAHQLYLFEQGRLIEKPAWEFLKGYLSAQGVEFTLVTQQTFADGNFEARADAVVHYPDEDVYDLYEIKSSSSVKKEHKYDLTFQRLVTETSYPVRSSYIVHLNKDFIKDGEIEINDLFIAANMDEEVENLKSEVLSRRELAWQIAESPTSEGIEDCLKPKDCPCPQLCHPGLPPFPIYDISRLHKNKSRKLKESGITAIRDIPDDFPLSERQQAQVQVVKSGKPMIDRAAIDSELARLEYPLYFLDYETFNPALPWYDGYKIYQHIVFQYSLHIIPAPGEEPIHHECLITDGGDPGIQLAAHLAEHIGRSGSVIVWNKAFEASKNRDMAERYPQYREVLENINARIFDLMEIFSKGLFIHPDFHGSASIKNVLPVLVQDEALNYDVLPIPRGTDAMMAWKDIMTGETAPEDIPQKREDLLNYCELDTLAMVRIWQALLALE